MKVKPDFSAIKHSFVEERYKLFSTEYVDSKTKLEYECPKGHKHSITYGNWRAGYRCPYCAGQGKPTIDEIEKNFEKESYTLISKEYKNNNTKLRYICPEGHKHSISWSEWKNLGNRCPYCSGNAKLSVYDVKASFDNEGYTLLADEHINSQTKLKYMCNNGHTHAITWSNWLFGKRCPSCSGNLKHSYEFVKRKVEDDGYKLLSKAYKNANTKLEVICGKGHTFRPTWHSWHEGKRCPICPSQQSHFEKEIRLLLDKNNITYTTNNRTMLINPITNRALELDIVLSSKKAIECNGNYWHSTPKVKARDIIKKKLCCESGINLLLISDEDWYSSKNEVENKIINFLNEE